MRKSRVLSVLFVAASILLLSSCSNTPIMAQKVSVNVGLGVNARIVPPYWAPYYDNVERVHYYYLPDIECYYDVWNQEFVYPENGNWLFASQLPPYYSWYDFTNPFVVLLDYNVHNPWMHNHFYVEHYPKYYYRTVYRNTYNDAHHPIYGFNENIKAVLYRNPNGRIPNHEYREPINKISVQSSHEPQRMEHHGKEIGQPVRVQREMMRPH